MWPSLPAGKFRHPDHRFEWTRAEFKNWAESICKRFDYTVEILPVGPFDESVGAPTQMGIFRILPEGAIAEKLQTEAQTKFDSQELEQ